MHRLQKFRVEISRMPQEALRKNLGLDFLYENNFFHPNQLKCIARGVRDIWNSPFSPIYRKKGEEVVIFPEATLLRKYSGQT